MKDGKSIGVLRFPCTAAGAKPMYDLVSILEKLFERVCVISGNDAFKEFDFTENVEVHHVNHPSSSRSALRAIRYIRTQIRLGISLLRAKDVGSYIFFDANLLIIPMILGKLFKKNISLLLTGYPATGDDVPDNDDISSPFWNFYLGLSDDLILYTPGLIREWDLEEYKDKISIAHRHIIDVDSLKIEKKWEERVFDVGYIGRFSPKKNVMGFLKSVSSLAGDGKKYKILLGGDGTEKERSMDFIEKVDLEKYITITGWISRDELPSYLNDLKLLIIPSYFEGLPNMMLEAMACGTIVLASRVGSIPDIIEDGKNGFLLDDNSPEAISKGILKIFERKNIDDIVQNARSTVENRFSKKAAIRNFEYLLKKNISER